MIGQTLSHYEIQAKLGEGGMGVVYRARDTRLDRAVAIKVLRPEAVGDPERKWRFVREARAASALNHPNIVTIHDIDSANGVDFIAMEYVEGQALDRVIPTQGLPLEQAVSYGAQIAGALAAAHAAGIVHRDVKPANVVVTSAGQVKVLDFGLAKLIEAGAEVTATSSVETDLATGRAVPRTQQGVVLGTLSYMSPEQAQGKPVDARSDVFSFGMVLYEMLAGRRPFQGGSHILTITAILRDPPAPLKTWRSDVPADLERILLQCLEKRPESRYPSAAELRKDLADVQARLTSPAPRLRSLLRRPRFAVPALLLFLAAAATAAWFWQRASRARWARETALPEIARLTQEGNYDAAVRLARQAEGHIPKDPRLQQALHDITVPISVRTAPAGAKVYVKSYLANDETWDYLGKAPISDKRVPFGYHRFRVSKEGFDTVEGSFAPSLEAMIQFTLDPPGTSPPGMVRVPGGPFQHRSAPPVELQDFWLDKYEVTNRDFKEFVERGGYQKREYWKHPFLQNGKERSWEEAMAQFRDATGRPGPSTWELGTYPGGRADFPVAGVSWFEAAAYAEFAGKSLPTIYHWYRAAGHLIFEDILSVSNFGEGPARVGSHRGLGPYGTYDMAGNVKEWCWNQAGTRRYILGGAWGEPTYMFAAYDAQSPFGRAGTYGFRCAKYAAPLGAALLRPMETLSPDFTKEKPVGDDVFRFYQSIYSYDRTDLEAVVESVTEVEHWRKEKITFNAAYGNERVIAYLFLPRNASPPYQTVIWFPGSYAQIFKSSDNLGLTFFFDFLPRTGRALLYPIYKDTYERRVASGSGGPNVERDLMIQRSKDLGRSIDYLETRKDIDRERLAFYGYSWGAAEGPILTAVEKRLKTSVLLAGGLYLGELPPEVNPLNFAPRAKIPVLMLNGRNDYIFSLESSQVPLFRLLGAPEQHKRHALFDSGHVPPPNDVIKEVLDWLDRYLGPVKTRPSASS